jgi:hypothetical protein
MKMGCVGEPPQVQILLGYKSGMTTEIYAHLADRYLQEVLNLLPSPNSGTISDISIVLPGRGLAKALNKLRNTSKNLSQILIPLGQSRGI